MKKLVFIYLENGIDFSEIDFLLVEFVNANFIAVDEVERKTDDLSKHTTRNNQQRKKILAKDLNVF